MIKRVMGGDKKEVPKGEEEHRDMMYIGGEEVIQVYGVCV